jgi:B12-binding domain/radical SAM domain protein
LSASYFHKELIEDPHVDFIVRGDSTEEPLKRLLERIVSGSGRHEFESIPNLTWKGKNGAVHVNALSYSPSDLNETSMDHRFAVRAVARDRNLADYLPFLKWTRYPISATLTCKGCTQNCTICGGSRFSYGTFYGRKKIAYRDPEAAAHDIRVITRYSRGPVFVLGDIRQSGVDYAKNFLRAIQGIDAQMIFEFFWGVEKKLIEEIAGAVRRFVIQISPESHDPRVLKLANKSFTTQTIESTIRNVLSSECQRLDVFFMSGMPGQTYASVMASVAYCGRMLHYFDGDPRLRFFMSPLAPFLDPGSLAYERPDRYGYRKLCHTLSEHRDALLAPSWKYSLSYETNWMKRPEIVDSTYQAALRLNKYKETYGQIESDKSQLVEDRILKAVALMKHIDRLVYRNDRRKIFLELQRLRPEIEEVNSSTLCEKEELDLPVNSRVPVKMFNTASMLIGDKMRKLWRKTAARG